MTQGPSKQNGDDDHAHDLLEWCITADNGQRCRLNIMPLFQHGVLPDPHDKPHKLVAARIVNPDEGPALLLSQTAGLPSGDGDEWRTTVLLWYDRAVDSSTPMFRKQTARNNNQEIRFLEGGPLLGSVVEAEPTTDAQFSYRVTLSRPRNGHYAMVLRFRSATRYADGQTLPVVDAEMPGILRRAGLWWADSPCPPRPGARHGICDTAPCGAAPG